MHNRSANGHGVYRHRRIGGGGGGGGGDRLTDTIRPLCTYVIFVSPPPPDLDLFAVFSNSRVYGVFSSTPAVNFSYTPPRFRLTRRHTLFENAFIPLSNILSTNVTMNTYRAWSIYPGVCTQYSFLVEIRDVGGV